MAWLIVLGLVIIFGMLTLLFFAQKRREPSSLLLVEPLLALSEKYVLVRYLGHEPEVRKLFGYCKGYLFQHESLTEDLLRQIEYRPNSHTERVELIDCKIWPLFGETKIIQDGKRMVSISIAQLCELSQKVEIDQDVLGQAEVLSKNGYLVLGVSSAVIHSTKNKEVVEQFIGALVLEPVWKKPLIENLRKLALEEKVKLVTVANKTFAAWIYEQIFHTQPSEVATTATLNLEKSVLAWEAQARNAEVIAEADLKTRYHLARFFLHKDSPSLLSSNPEDKQLPLKVRQLK